MKVVDLNQLGRLEVRRSFGVALRALRTERGVSQEDLGEWCNWDRSYTSHLERGRYQPTLHMLFRLGKALELAPEVFVVRTALQLELDSYADEVPIGFSQRERVFRLIGGETGVEEVAGDVHERWVDALAAVSRENDVRRASGQALWRAIVVYARTGTVPLGVSQERGG